MNITITLKEINPVIMLTGEWHIKYFWSEFVFSNFTASIIYHKHMPINSIKTTI